MPVLAVYDFITDMGMATQVWKMRVEQYRQYCTISFEIICIERDLDNFIRTHLPPLLKEKGL